MLLTPLVRHSPFMNSEEANIYIAMLEKTSNNVKMLEMKTDEAKIQLRKREIEVDTIKLNLRNIIPKKRKTNDYDTSIEKMTEAAINVRMTELKATGAIAEANSVISEIENLLVMKAETKAGAEARAEAGAGAEARAEVEAEAKAGDEDENETIASLANKWKKIQADEKARAEAETKAIAEAEAKAREEAEAKSSVEAEANTRAKKKARAEAEVKARAEANARAREARASLAKAWTEANARDEAIRKNNETVVDNEIEMSTTPFPSTAYKCDELYIEEKRKRLIKRHISRYCQNPTYKDLWKINLNLVKEFIDKNKTSPKGEFAKWISNQTTNFITNKNMMEDTEIKELWKNFIENYN
jgi:chromosome segregation ATPase